MVVYNIFNISFDLLRQEDKDYVPIFKKKNCFPVAAFHPSWYIYFYFFAFRRTKEGGQDSMIKGKSVDIPD